MPSLPLGPRCLAGLSVLAAALAWLACAAEESVAPVAEREPAPPAPFEDLSVLLGVDFVHRNGMTGEFLYPEMMGSGVALLDYDGDGDLDLYLVQGGSLGRSLNGTARAGDRLYRNDWSGSEDGESGWRFIDVTTSSGVSAFGYGMGAAVADYDRDGWLDVYVTNLGENQLLGNRGDGTFEDRTAVAGVGDAGWGVPAAFFDYDGDGWLDLYVGNYLDYSVAGDVPCFDTTGARDYCGPTAYPGARDRLFRNRGDGSFEDVSETTGVGRPRGRTLGSLVGDFDRDGRPDLYVANDGEPNFLWLNRDPSFEETALLSGLAIDGRGRPQASMGVAAGDYDRDGDEDLLITHLTGEFNTLYRNAGDGRFEDHSRPSGLGVPSLPLTGFGVAWIDYDGDGWLDLLSSNGAVKSLESQRRLGDPFPLRQPKQLYRNRGDGTFDEVSGEAGHALTRAAVGRGLAVGDLDADGDEDVVSTHNNGPAALLLNVGRPERSWTAVDGLPLLTRVVAEAPGGALAARARSAGSYASASSSRVVIALDGESRELTLQVEHPRGRMRLARVPVGRCLVFGR